MKIKELILSDLRRYGISSTRKLSYMEKRELFGFKYSKTLRLCNYYHSQNKIMFLFYRIKLYRLSIKYGINIPYSTKIGPGFYIGHSGNIVVNSNSIIGRNVNISQGVTIGFSNSNKNKGTPKIGNNVWIGANAVIVGNITIGDDVIIAPGVFVNFDVPSGSIVIFEKAKIIPKRNCTLPYIENRYEEIYND